MINLIFTIILFNILIVIFKLFEKYQVDTLQALIINYLTAGICAFLFIETKFSISYILQSQWIYHAIIIGTLFMITFIVFSIGVQKIGISLTTITNKMSLIIPVCAALIFYPEKEKMTILKTVGLILAFVAIFLASTKSGKLIINKKYFWVVLILFFGQGICDTIFNDFAQIYSNTLSQDSYLFFMTLFFIASLIGILIYILKLNKKNIKFKNILWGIIFGIPNFFSLFFFLKVLANPKMESSDIFPLLSMGIVLTSAFIGWYIFKERISRNNWVGIILSIFAIYLLAY